MAAPRTSFIRKMVKKILAESKIHQPPVDLRAIADKHGIEYVEMDDFPASVDALIIEEDSKVYAAVNKQQHIHRQRFSLAHELGHHFLHKNGIPVDTVSIDNPPTGEWEEPTKDPGETEADIFANELLVPVSMLREQLKGPKRTLAELSSVFLVSEHVISIAMTRHCNSLFK